MNNRRPHNPDLKLSIERYLEWCYAHESPPRVSELAALLGVDRATLRRWTLQHYDDTPSKLLARRRMSYARELREQTSLSTAQVAYRAAFGTRRTYFRQQRRGRDQSI